jgi:hypothetical protein
MAEIHDLDTDKGKERRKGKGKGKGRGFQVDHPNQVDNFTVYSRLAPMGCWAGLSKIQLERLLTPGDFLDDEVVAWTLW